MKNVLLIIIILPLLSASACKSTHVDPNTYPDKRIVFGDGGGFSGFVNTYCILDNGMKYKKMHRDTGFVYVSTVKKDMAQQAIINFSALGFDKEDMNTPGNAYHFMEFIDGDTRHRLVWDPHKEEEYKKINTYYRATRALFFKDQKAID